MLIVVAKAAICYDVLIDIHLSPHVTNAALSLYSLIRHCFLQGYVMFVELIYDKQM